MDSNLRLMVVDDEPIVGKRLKRLLYKAGYDIDIFTEGSIAIEELGKKSFDIIIADLKMKGINGMDILEIVKKKYPHIKVIIITGYGKKLTAIEAFNKGAFDFITKPFKIKELENIIKKAEMELRSKNKHFF